MTKKGFMGSRSVDNIAIVSSDRQINDDLFQGPGPLFPPDTNTNSSPDPPIANVY